MISRAPGSQTFWLDSPIEWIAMTQDHSADRPAQFGRRTLLRAAALAAASTPFLSLSAAQSASAANACNTLLLTDGFDTPSAGNWTRLSVNGTGQDILSTDLWSDRTKFDPARHAIVPDPAGTGNGVMRFTVPADQSSYRAELTRRQFPYGRYRYTVSHFIPADYVPYRYETILAQWHGYTLPNGESTNPPLYLTLSGAPTPEWRFVRYELQPDLTNIPTQSVLAVPVKYGEWTDWTIDITWSTPTSPGRVVVLNDGVVVFEHDGVNNYHQDSAPYFKAGIYRASWRTGGYPAQPDLVVYHKDITARDLTSCTTTPVGVTDSLTTTGDPATVAPLANDVNAGEQTTVDPASLRLLDSSGAPVTTLDVDGQGKWSVNSATAEITFAAAAGFAGASTPVRYRAQFVAADGTLQTFGSEVRAQVDREAVVVRPDEVATRGSAPVTVSPLSNDDSGRLDPATLRLVDPATSADTATVALAGIGLFETAASSGARALLSAQAGVAAGEIRFTPARGFEGAARVQYRVDDLFGRTVASDVTIIVRDNPAAAVPPRPGGSAPADPDAVATGPGETGSVSARLAATGSDGPSAATLGVAAGAVAAGVALAATVRRRSAANHVAADEDAQG